MSSRYSDNRSTDEKSGRGPRKGEPRWGKWFIGILLGVLIIATAGGGLIYYFGHSLFSLTNFVSETQKVISADELPDEARETVSAKDRRGTVLNESEIDNLHQKWKAVDDRISTVSNEDVYNIVLVGVDRREKDWNGNSDSMMLISVNFKEERVSIISLMRDTYVNIPEVGYNKLNNSYARGGGDLLCSTITDNFNIDVSRYAAVDFENMIDIIDALGGIDIEWTSAEIEVANGYIRDMCKDLGLDAWDYLMPVEGAGIWHCDGVRAVAYARNRFVGNSDYSRTERQRYVISQMISKIKEMNIGQLMSFARKVLPLIRHNVKEAEIWELITKAPAILRYSIVKDRVPYDGEYTVINIEDQDMLSPNWEETILQMHDTIYGDGSVSGNEDNDEDKRTEGYHQFTQQFSDITGTAGDDQAQVMETEFE